jgi:hypothetical protein
VNAHIESHWRNPPRKQFRFVRDRSGWRLNDVHLAVVIHSNRTWVVGGQETPELLNHEQGHWDITGLIAREALQAYGRLRARMPKELTEQLRHIQTRLQNKATRINRKYDSETNHGSNLDAQQKWDVLLTACIANTRPLPDAAPTPN